MSYQLLLDLLFEKKRFQDVLDAYDIIKSRQLQNGRFPKHVMVLVFAACYKLNTPDSLKYGLELWKELQQAGHIPMRKGATFIAAAALNQQSPVSFTVLFFSCLDPLI
jgi:pentatricopeptide repeat domain-containing protein 2